MQKKLLLLPFLCALSPAQNAEYAAASPKKSKPNIILVMSDDQGWGQTGYYNHPVLKTPDQDDMALHGLRLDSFYAGALVCSPTRASVLTGRSNDRNAVSGVGYPMRKQEKTLAQVSQNHYGGLKNFGPKTVGGLRGYKSERYEGGLRVPW